MLPLPRMARKKSHGSKNQAQRGLLCPHFFTTIAMTDFKDLIQKMHGILVQAQGERDRGPTNTGRQAGG
jgi:hypothetical protein